MTEFISAFGSNVAFGALFGIGWVIYKKSTCSYNSTTGWDVNFKLPTGEEEADDSEDEHIEVIIKKLLERKETKRKKKPESISTNFVDNTIENPTNDI